MYKDMLIIDHLHHILGLVEVISDKLLEILFSNSQCQHASLSKIRFFFSKFELKKSPYGLLISEFSFYTYLLIGGAHILGSTREIDFVLVWVESFTH